MEELLQLALEGRRRVKEQLKKMGSFEYYQNLVSATRLTRPVKRSSLAFPEQGGKDLIFARTH